MIFSAQRTRFAFGDEKYIVSTFATTPTEAMITAAISTDWLDIQSDTWHTQRSEKESLRTSREPAGTRIRKDTPVCASISAHLHTCKRANTQARAHKPQPDDVGRASANMEATIPQIDIGTPVTEQS